QDGINNNTLVSVQYSDGFGRMIQARTQCEEVIFGDSIFGSSGLVSSGTDGAAVGVENTSDTLNVTVNGWKVYDNKGRVVETYESYYDKGFDYQSPLAAGTGADALKRSKKVQLFYDPRGQVIKTINPDNTQQRVLFGIPLALDNPNVFTPTPWESYTYDPNDLAELTHPGDTTVPVGHHYTPSSGVIDALGRTVKTIDRNFKSGAVEEIVMQYTYDIRGNQLTVVDPYNRTVFDHTYDLANRPLKTTHIDGGTKYIFLDCMNRPSEARDAKGALILSAYDNLSRPMKVWCRDKTGESVLLRSKTIYGDAAGLVNPQDYNLLGKPYQVYDEAGLTTMNMYDFKGNPMEKTREVIADSEILAVFSGPPAGWNVSCYRVNWDASVTLEGSYVSSMEYDALNRVRSVTYPEDVNGERKVLTPTYNRSGALTSVAMDGDTYVDRIAYDAKGQQLLVAYGNGIMTRFLYREDNFRLLRLKSEKYIKSGLTYTPNSGVKQNYSYQYDLSGNIINLSDTTADCGYGATPDSLSRDFVYDALYRLLSATGRETAATAVTPWEDLYRPQDESLARGYTQQYDYDKLGNIQELQHIATGGSFTRSFDYGSFTKNALQKITIGSNVYDFAYDVNGNMLSEGDTARHLEYDCADRLRAFFVQTGTAEPSKYTHYLYDGSGNRVKKITRRQGGKYTATTYIDGAFEYTKESTGFDGIPNLTIGTWVIGQYSSGGEQNIIHIMGGATKRIGADLGDSTPAIKYNLSDHLGSSCVQLDTNGTTVSLEEYYPFGETSFGSYAKKRYRFCGKEKDKESGLYYYGMRYYSPWTCRFINVDPLAGKYANLTPYAYADNKPINHTDLDGAETGSTQPTPSNENNANTNSTSDNINSTQETSSNNLDCIEDISPTENNPQNTTQTSTNKTSGILEQRITGTKNLVILYSGDPIENKNKWISPQSQNYELSKQINENWDYIVIDDFSKVGDFVKQYVEKYGKLENVVVRSHGFGHVPIGNGPQLLHGNPGGNSILAKDIIGYMKGHVTDAAKGRVMDSLKVIRDNSSTKANIIIAACGVGTDKDFVNAFSTFFKVLDSERVIFMNQDLTDRVRMMNLLPLTDKMRYSWIKSDKNGQEELKQGDYLGNIKLNASGEPFSILYQKKGTGGSTENPAIFKK
ncbi:MAG: RHS repeat domain-containing protein, partial [Cytophaga sp.]|uniref:RHS repeat domain-containing protein n=1 Tax=Cytophaga sp. TaxID=29535 RepID=UPI003F813E2A